VERPQKGIKAIYLETTPLQMLSPLGTGHSIFQNTPGSKKSGVMHFYLKHEVPLLPASTQKHPSFWKI